MDHDATSCLAQIALDLPGFVVLAAGEYGTDSKEANGRAAPTNAAVVINQTLMGGPVATFGSPS